MVSHGLQWSRMAYWRTSSNNVSEEQTLFENLSAAKDGCSDHMIARKDRLAQDGGVGWDGPNHMFASNENPVPDGGKG